MSGKEPPKKPINENYVPTIPGQNNYRPGKEQGNFRPDPGNNTSQTKPPPPSKK